MCFLDMSLVSTIYLQHGYIQESNKWNQRWHTISLHIPDNRYIKYKWGTFGHFFVHHGSVIHPVYLFFPFVGMAIEFFYAKSSPWSGMLQNVLNIKSLLKFHPLLSTSCAQVREDNLNGANLLSLLLFEDWFTIAQKIVL